MARFEVGDEFSVWENQPERMTKFKKKIEDIKKWQKEQIKEFEEKEARLEEDIKQLEKVLSSTVDETEREETRDRIKAIKEIISRGSNKTITFFQTKDYKYNFSPNTKIKYKEIIDKIDRNTGRPLYKTKNIVVRLGRVRTSDPEQIAFLDIHEGYKRDSDRELTPLEKEKKAIETARIEKEELERKVADMKKILEKGQELISKTPLEKIDGNKSKK